MKKILVFVLLAGLTLVGLAAQTSTVSHPVTLTVNAIALVGLSDSGAGFTLRVVDPAAAGDNPVGETNNLVYLRYTTVNTTGTNRTITVEWGAAEAAPAGTSLKVTAGPAGGQGSATAQRTISNTAQTLITAIPSCATGTGAGSGAQLSYVFSVDTPTSLVAGESQTVNVKYTLTEDS